MFSYTRGIIGDTINSIKKIAYGLDVATQIIYMGYLIFSLIIKRGIFIANSIILFVSIVYFIYFLSTTKQWYTKEQKGKRKKVKMLLKAFKRIINFVVIVIAVVELCINPTDKDNVALLLTIMMILGLVLAIMFDLISSVISARLKLIYAAIEVDVENIKKPITATTNFVKKMVGKEVSSQEIDSSTLEKLNIIRENQKEKKKEKKIWEKEIKEKKKISIR